MDFVEYGDDDPYMYQTVIQSGLRYNIVSYTRDVHLILALMSFHTIWL